MNYRLLTTAIAAILSLSQCYSFVTEDARILPGSFYRSDESARLCNMTFNVRADMESGVSTYGAQQGGLSNVDSENYDLRYICEIWEARTGYNDYLVGRYYSIIKDNFSINSPSFNVQFDPSQKHYFYFWADFVAEGTTEANAPYADLYYTTSQGKTAAEITADHYCDSGLLYIEVRNPSVYEANNEARDAYTARYFMSAGSYSSYAGLDYPNDGPIITLKRVFGKYCVFANYPSTATAHADSIVQFDMRYTGKLFSACLAGGTVYRDFKFTPPTAYSVKRPVSIETITLSDTTYANARVMAFDYLLPGDTTHLSVRAFDANGVQKGQTRNFSFYVSQGTLTYLNGELF